MTLWRRFILKNLFCAILFYLDFRTGMFGASFFLVVAVVVHFFRALLGRERYLAALTLSAPYLFWIASLLIVGFTSNELAKTEVQKIIGKATIFKSDTGRYPDSLRELAGYLGALDNHAHLRVGSSEVFLSDGTIVYRKFPGRWASYNLESGQEKGSDIY